MEITRLSHVAGCLDSEYEETSSCYLTQLREPNKVISFLSCMCFSFSIFNPSSFQENISISKSDSQTDQSAVEELPNENFGPSPILFEKLQLSVRGRVKFEVVSASFRIINESCAIKNSKMVKGAPPEPVTLKELHEKGANVHGRSGEQVLASLRALGLITVDKRGVCLVPVKKIQARGT
jgi:hypothetical protein